MAPNLLEEGIEFKETFILEMDIKFANDTTAKAAYFSQKMMVLIHLIINRDNRNNKEIIKSSLYRTVKNRNKHNKYRLQ